MDYARVESHRAAAGVSLSLFKESTSVLQLAGLRVELARHRCTSACAVGPHSRSTDPASLSCLVLWGQRGCVTNSGLSPSPDSSRSSPSHPLPPVLIDRPENLLFIVCRSRCEQEGSQNPGLYRASLFNKQLLNMRVFNFSYLCILRDILLTVGGPSSPSRVGGGGGAQAA